MRILLTGGTGLIGRALCQHWLRQGHEPIVWSRDAQGVPQLCHGARGVSSLQALSGQAPIDAVVNLAGAPIADRPWSAQRRALLWASRVELTTHLVDWIGQQAQRPAVLVSGSAVGWYGDGGERVLDESAPPGHADFGSRLCVAWEDAAERASALGVRVVRVRTAPVLSAAGGMLARLRLPFSLGLGGRLGSGQQWMPWIHLDDEVRLIDHVLMHPECSGAYNACAPEPVRNAAFTEALAHALHRPAVLPAPAWALRMALGEMSVLLLGGQRTQAQRILAAGFQFQHPQLDDALAHLLSPK